MFDSGIERTVIGTAVVLWFAHGWYLNTRLLAVHRKLDLVLENLYGLRDYLYEIDPQFDDERQSVEAVLENDALFAGMSDMELVERKRAEGKRTLDTPFARE